MWHLSFMVISDVYRSTIPDKLLSAVILSGFQSSPGVLNPLSEAVSGNFTGVNFIKLIILWKVVVNFNINQYQSSYHKDNMVSWPSYLFTNIVRYTVYTINIMT